MNNNRINICFSKLKKDKKPAFIAFLTACDPSFSMSLKLLKAMPRAGVDIIEIGMPFSDPMADGPVIQRSYIRALKSGEKVTIPGFGTFEVRHRNARMGRNPQTGESIQIKASNTPGFKAGKALKDALN